MTRVDPNLPFAPDLEWALPFVFVQTATGRQMRVHRFFWWNPADTVTKAMAFRDTE